MKLFYTGKGDKGKSIVGSHKVDKTSIELEALGGLDELNSLLGLIKNLNRSTSHQGLIKEVQENLFIIQAQVGTILFGGKYRTPEFPELKVKKLEAEIDKIEQAVKPSRSFVISGRTVMSAWFDFARAVARRTERSMWRLSKKRRIEGPILAYLNRLSSFLFALARQSSKRAGKKEEKPSYR